MSVGRENKISRKTRKDIRNGNRTCLWWPCGGKRSMVQIGDKLLSNLDVGSGVHSLLSSDCASVFNSGQSVPSTSCLSLVLDLANILEHQGLPKKDKDTPAAAAAAYPRGVGGQTLKNLSITMQGTGWAVSIMFYQMILIILEDGALLCLRLARPSLVVLIPSLTPNHPSILTITM